MRDLEPALQLIKEFEGLKLRAYADPATGGAPWTIGYGSTRDLQGNAIKPGQSIDLETAAAMLAKDVSAFVAGLERMLTVPVSNNEFCALLCWTYNVGLGNAAKSTLLKLLNANAPRADVAAQFLRWDRAGGKKMPGLARRRASEAKLFLQA
jgi:lysozyme